jgi:hypothetical protein
METKRNPSAIEIEATTGECRQSPGNRGIDGRLRILQPCLLVQVVPDSPVPAHALADKSPDCRLDPAQLSRSTLRGPAPVSEMARDSEQADSGDRTWKIPRDVIV